MPTIRIDNQDVPFTPGETVLTVARRRGAEIPTLCDVPDKDPLTSCMVCLVEVVGREGFVPSCAAVCEEGMEVRTETPAVLEARKAALEMLLAEHLGDCVAPCTSACPAGADIPRMLRRIGEGKVHEAVEVVKADLPLPAVLGRVCPAPCERACRRAAADGAVAIARLHGYVAEADMRSDHHFVPKPAAETGKSVAIVGTGPAGLSAAWFLRLGGHACTVFERRDQAGGMLRYAIEPQRLPREVLQAEIDCMANMGVEFRCGVDVGRDITLDQLREKYDAVLLATGRLSHTERPFGMDVYDGKLPVASDSMQTAIKGVFAAGDAVNPRRMAVRSVAGGKSAADAIGRMLAGGKPKVAPRRWSCHMGRPDDEELRIFLADASDAGRMSDDMTPDTIADLDARAEARRCLRCDCRKQSSCKLRSWAERYGASPTRLRRERRDYERVEHPEVIYEPSKCIRCGVCIREAAEAREPLGLTFEGRGFDMRLAVPFGEPLSEGLRRAARRCAQACPTGALSLRHGED
ncbi:MAG: 2Fe-2S iron-sulfur cluster-binding protein [Planctomycetota bacterium]